MPRRKSATTFKPGASGNPATTWKKGQSGNPAGASKRRLQFNQAFIDALAGEGTAEEAAKLVWDAARKGEAWAVQMIYAKLAPQEQSLRLVHERGNDQDGIDYSRLTDEQIRQLRSILEFAVTGNAPRLEDGSGPAVIS